MVRLRGMKAAIRHLFTAGAALVVSGGAAPGAEPETGEKENEPTILEIAGEKDNLTTFLRALEGTELEEALAGDGPYTVFVPGDEAFDLLPADVLEQLLAPGQRHFRTRLLSHHVVADTVSSAGLLGKGETFFETAAGGRIAVISEKEMFLVETAEVAERDLAAGNGVLHVIDRILVPRD